MEPKENLLRTLNWDDPEYIPYGLESVRTFWHRDARFFFGNGDPLAEEWTDIWGVEWKRGKAGAPESFYPVSSPLKNIDELDSFPFPDPYDPGIFMEIVPEIKKVNRDEELIMLSNPGCLFTRAWLLRGMENFLTDMLLHPEEAGALLDRILAYQLAVLRQELAYKPDLVYFGDDLGTTKALLMHPDVWRGMIKPRLAALTTLCREAGCYVVLHTCGKAEEIVDDIIEIGVNVLNPVQASANDFTLLKNKSRGKLTLYGGINADLLVRGTLHEVTENTRLTIQQLGNGGGYIANPDQLLPFPQENIAALRETVLKEGKLR